MEVEVQNLSKQYGNKYALKEISCAIPKGKFTVILGPSGSGKTTFLRLLAGLLAPDSGAIKFDGEDVTDTPASKRNIALVFQNYTLFPHMTIEKNLRFALESKKEGKFFKRNAFSEQEISEKVRDTMKLLHIEEHRNKYPSQLSGGEKQRVAIGREVIREPGLYLFDEPLSNIDARLRFEMRTWIRRLHILLKKSMIYVTHDQNEAMALGDNVILLNQGQIVQIGSPSELYSNPEEKFTAKFIGNYPMNFLPFEKKEMNLYLEKSNERFLPKRISKLILEKNVQEGEVGFRAENAREYDETKRLEDDMVLLKCTVKDIESVLERQIITLEYHGYRLLFVTKTTKNFEIEEKVSIVVHAEDIFIFDETEKRVR